MNVCTCGHNYYGVDSEEMTAGVNSGRDLTTPTQNNIPEFGGAGATRSSQRKALVPTPFLDSSFVEISSSILRQEVPAIIQNRKTKVDANNEISAYNRHEFVGGVNDNSNNASIIGKESRAFRHYVGFLEDYEKLKILQQCLETPSRPSALTVESVNRLQAALDADTKRLQQECLIYDNAVKDNQVRQKVWNQAINQITSFASTSSKHDQNTQALDVDGTKFEADRERNDELNYSIAWKNVECAEEAFRIEIEALEHACQQHEKELSNLNLLHSEQLRLQKELDKAYDSLAEEQNALVLEARAFDNDQEQLSRSLATVQDELERVSSSSIHLPAMLFQLEIDKRGLRYPLINKLRLAYRPKGDVQWEEIQGAWSQAAQLVLITGTLFEFQSKHCKIVPLSQCAKLMYYPPDESVPCSKAVNQKRRDSVYNLGHPATNAKRALLTWNALMCQIIHFVIKKMKDAVDRGLIEASNELPPLPFEISSTKVGNINLTQLDENDDAGWSQAIHYMAFNLQWLSECASVYALNEVLLV